MIDDQSDATFLPLISTEAGPQLDIEYRRRFNDGTVLVNTSAGYTDGTPQGSFASRGQFTYDDTWRYGFDINRASSTTYVTDFHLTEGLTGDPNILSSQLYLEGFGDGSYTRLDSKFYQALNTVIDTSALPIVLPRYEYSFVGTPDSLGGRFSLETGAFNVIRTEGATSTRRASLTMDYERPFSGLLGDQWKITLHGDAAAYDASDLNGIPNFSTYNNVDTARALPQVAVDFHWPFARDGGSWGTQLIEPIVQVIVAPQTGNSQVNRYPNEDSLDFEFTDANLFGFNRFTGIDRLDGGERANVAMHGAWYLGGVTFDGLVGQVYRTNKDDSVSRGIRAARPGFRHRRPRHVFADQLARRDLPDAPRQVVAGHSLRRGGLVGGGGKVQGLRRLYLHELQPVQLITSRLPHHHWCQSKRLLLSAQRGHPRGNIKMGLLQVQWDGCPRLGDQPNGLGRGRRNL